MGRGIPRQHYRFAGALEDGQVGIACGARMFLIFEVLREIGDAGQAYTNAESQGPETSAEERSEGEKERGKRQYVNSRHSQ